MVEFPTYRTGIDSFEQDRMGVPLLSSVKVLYPCTIVGSWKRSVGRIPGRQAGHDWRVLELPPHCHLRKLCGSEGW